MTSFRPLAVTAVVVGLLVGVVAALAIPTTRPARGAAGSPGGAPAAGVVPGTDTVARVAPARAPLRGDVEVRPTGPVRIEARVADPLGGPDWAVRVFAAERVIRKGQRRHGVSPVIGRPLCAQLGRIHQGRFGWLEADGTFRPLRVGTEDGAASTCGSRRPSLNGAPLLSTLSPITDPNAPAARVKSTIAWGLAGSAARSVTLTAAGRTVVAPRTAHNAYVVAFGPEVSQRAIGGTATYPGGRRRTLGGGRFAPLPGIGRPDGTLTLAARAPDPNGGLPFAMTVARAKTGGWCESIGGRVVGDRVGGVDFARDILSERLFSGGGSCAGGRQDVFKDRPVLLSTMSASGNAPQEGEDTGGTGRVARRTQQGTTLLSGEAAPDVVAVTIETPRDVRTLIPSGPSNAILAAYDGSFKTGSVRVTARYRDGHTSSFAIPNLAL
jgi:hypothetical protein